MRTTILKALLQYEKPYVKKNFIIVRKRIKVVIVLEKIEHKFHNIS